MKVTKFDEIFLLVLTLLNNVKNKGEISSNCCGVLRKPQFYFYNQFTLQFYKIEAALEYVIVDLKPTRLNIISINRLWGHVRGW